MNRFLRLLPWVSTIVLIVVVVYAGVFGFFRHGPITTVYIVRHAEKVDGTGDVVLSSAGRARAQELARILTDAELEAVFSTHFQRTRQTGQPTVDTAPGVSSLTPYSDSRAVADVIKSTYAGRHVLVVGHSNTVDDIAIALGAEGITELNESQYDRLYVVHHTIGQTIVDKLRYGAVTP